MKKTILLSGIFLLAVSFSFGQFVEKGSMMFNGNISYYTGKTKEENTGFTQEYTSTHILSGLMFQYFIINNLAVGAMVNNQLSIDKDDSGNKFTESDFLFGPVARYYIWQALFAQAS